MENIFVIFPIILDSLQYFSRYNNSYRFATVAAITTNRKAANTN